MAGPENIKAGFLKERDIFAENNVVYASPFVSLGDRHLVTEQLYVSLKDVFDLDAEGNGSRGVRGFAALDDVTERMSEARPGNSHVVRGKSEALCLGARPPVSHGHRDRPRDRSGAAGLRLSDSLVAISSH